VSSRADEGGEAGACAAALNRRSKRSNGVRCTQVEKEKGEEGGGGFRPRTWPAATRCRKGGSRVAGRGTEPAGAATVCDRWIRGGKWWQVGWFRKLEREMGQAQRNSAERRWDLNLNFKRI
jgi:hypothetical protein